MGNRSTISCAISFRVATRSPDPFLSMKLGSGRRKRMGELSGTGPRVTMIGVPRW